MPGGILMRRAGGGRHSRAMTDNDDDAAPGDATAADATADETPTQPQPAPHRSRPSFVRPRDGRMLGGVCAGIAEHWDVDVTLVRIGAVVLALMTGFGVLGYLAAWLLTPSTDHPARLGPDSVAAHPGRRIPAVAVLVLLAVFALGFSRWLWFGPGHWGWFWFGPPFALLLVAVVVAFAFANRGIRLLLAAIVAIVLAMIAVVGIFGPHFGRHDISISRSSDLDDDYGYPFGNVTVDLTGLQLDEPRHTHVFVGRGDLTVIVPTTLPVTVDAYSAIGSVTVDGHEVSGLQAEQDRVLNNGLGSGSVLDLDLQVGAGSVTVRPA